ncbi:MAG: polyprenol monophosphomannose synthase [Planctomycetota bacterium]|nr:polyprenol monophosphomannose synthase [Planctomycetota bacterium]
MSDESRLLIAICTYNEIHNLPSLYESLRENFTRATLLVVDDRSPDGTGDWCDRTAEVDPLFRVLHRKEKSGLGSATLAAFEYGIEKDFDFVLTMDGDWSHHPAEARDVFDSLLHDPDCQLSIGSRYIRGGKIEGWPFKRHLMSFCINTYARWMIGLKTADCSGAFRCYRTSFLRQVDFARIQGMGYAYLEEILWWARCLQARITETPITFTNRTAGQSKINYKEAIRAVWIIFCIGLQRILRLKTPRPS